MFKSTLRIVAVATTLAAGTILAHAENPMVGGAAMYPDKNIIENAVNSVCAVSTPLNRDIPEH